MRHLLGLFLKYYNFVATGFSMSRVREVDSLLFFLNFFQCSNFRSVCVVWKLVLVFLTCFGNRGLCRYIYVVILLAFVIVTVFLRIDFQRGKTRTCIEVRNNFFCAKVTVFPLNEFCASLLISITFKPYCQGVQSLI